MEKIDRGTKIKDSPNSITMHPIEFKEQNKVYSKPESMTDEQCSSLPTWQGKDSDGFPLIVSCWQLSEDELKEINNNSGRIYLGVVSTVQPPVWLMVETPFKRICRVCGCTDDDCHQCIEKTGSPCHWVEDDLCSACK